MNYFLKRAILVSFILGSLPTAMAASRGKVKNCDDQRDVKICVYNGKDGALLQPKQTHTIKKGYWADFKCKGEGKHRCKVKIMNSSDLCTSTSKYVTVKDGEYKQVYKVKGNSNWTSTDTDGNGACNPN